MKWLKYHYRFIQYLKLDFFIFLPKYLMGRQRCKPTQYIPLHFAESFIPGKALHYKGLGHNFKDSDFHYVNPA